MQEKKYYSQLFGRKVITIVIAVTAFYILMAIYSDANQMVKYLNNVNIRFLSLILLSSLGSILLRSVRQLFLLRRLGIRLDFIHNLVIFFAGLSMTVTPGGMGQMIKSHYLLKYHGQPMSKTLPIVLAERYNDILALVSFIILFVAINNIAILRVPIIIIAAIVALVGFVIRHRSLLHFMQNLLMKMPILNSFKDSSFEFNSSLLSLFQNKILIFSWALTMAAFFFDAISIFMCFQSLKLNFNFGFTTAFGFSSVLFGAISFIPAGAGVTEISFVQLVSHYGIEISKATALVLLVRLSNVWFSTFIGVISTKFIAKNK